MLTHLRNSTDRFEPAEGEKGMVMTVFTLQVLKAFNPIFSE